MNTCWQYAFWTFSPSFKKDDSIFTHLVREEKRALFCLARGQGSDACEIGSYLGSSSCFLAASLRKWFRNSKLYCIDTWQNEAMSEGPRDTYEEFLRNTESYRDIIVPIRARSEDAVAVLAERTKTIDLLFIDADHSYEGCKRDWDLYSPFLHSGSLVILHDYGWAEGVKQVVSEDVRPRCFKEDSLPNMWWGWIK